MRFHFVRACLAFAVMAPGALAQVGSSDDLWDFSNGSVVTAHSTFDIDAGDRGGYDARDAFGGTFNDFPAAYGAVVFTDFAERGSVHYFEWRTPAPITLERFFVATSADHHAEDLRASSAFRLYAREEAGAPWMLLVDRVRAEQDILDHPLWTIDHEFERPVEGLVEFRAEFVQASGRVDYGGPRVYELDGFGWYSTPGLAGEAGDGSTAVSRGKSGVGGTTRLGRADSGCQGPLPGKHSPAHPARNIIPSREVPRGMPR